MLDNLILRFGSFSCFCILRNTLVQGLQVPSYPISITGGERTRVSADTLVKMALSSPRLVTGKLTDTAHLLETHTSWGYCRWYEEHWGGVSSRDRQSFNCNFNLKRCVVTRVMHISVFPMSRVTVFHVEGDATVDEGDACLIGQTVIDISRFHFCYSCLLCPLFNITRFKTQ